MRADHRREVSTGASTDPLSDKAETSACIRALARAHPDRIAVQVDDRSLTYSELDSTADEIAAGLLDRLGEEHHRIGLRMQGTIPMVLGVVGVSRAGMVSVPIDPTAPPERVRFIMDDVGGLVLVDDGGLGEVSTSFAVVTPEALRTRAPSDGVERSQGDLASIVFTSGSTGTPKGIMVPRAHRIGVPSKARYLGEVESGARVGALAAGTVGFGEALIHGLMQLGATLDAYEIRRLGLGSLVGWLERSQVMGFGTVPTIVRLVTSALPSTQIFEHLRLVVMTGETATWADIAALRPHLPDSAMIHNVFGLTETSAIALFSVDSSLPLGEGPLPAGTPLPTVKIQIVDQDGASLPPGEAGEIVVEGEGCALGYWNRAELTAQVFSVGSNGLPRVRTGDGGRLRKDGVLEHLGRLDHVVKVAGNRVELGEVEFALAGLEGVAMAAAAAFSDARGDTRLTAFVVPRPHQKLEEWSLRAALSRQLPGSMLPDSIHVVEDLPQLSNGKIDRQLLAVHAREPAALPDMTPLQLELLSIWRSVLDRTDIGPDENFFEIGGDSLRAAKVFAEIENRLGIDRPVGLMLEAPTVHQLAAALETDDRSLGLLVPVVTEGSLAPLFVVHDGKGDIFYASRIAAGLAPDRPVFAIQPALALSETARETTIEELAARYLVEVRGLRPHGPYLFYGYSLGGLIAFEMSRQLRQVGEKTALLALGDSPAPRPPFARRVISRLHEIAHLPAADRPARLRALTSNLVSHIHTLAHHGHQRMPSDISEFDISAFLGEELDARSAEVMWRYGSMALKYRPTPRYPDDLLLIRSDGPGLRPDRGWYHVVAGQISVRDIDCVHAELGRNPHAATVGRLIEDALAEKARSG